MSIERTAHASRIRPPCLRNPLASAGTALNGSARPSLAVNNAPFHCPGLSFNSSSTSALDNMRVSSWCCLAVSSHSSRLARSASVAATFNTPSRAKPISSPSSFDSDSQVLMLSIMMGSSAASRLCCRTQPQLRLDCSPATRPLSQTSTDTPCFARNQAVDIPMTPAPIMTTSTESGRESCHSMGVLSLKIILFPV